MSRPDEMDAWDDALAGEERERERRARLDDHAPAPRPRVVMEEVPLGEGDPQIEFYRALMGAKSVKSMRVEWGPMSDDAGDGVMG